MTASAEREMAEQDRSVASRAWWWLRIVALLFGIIFFTGFTAGMVGAHLDHGGGDLGVAMAAMICMALLAVAACGWMLWRTMRAHSGEEPLTPKERLNRNLLVASGVTGFLLAIALMAVGAGGPGERGDIFSNAPLPTAAAIALALVIGLLIPAISLYWHRIIDEQESDAIKTGALIGLYVYMIGAPVWWLLWRGGVAPEPDGFIIYFASSFTATAIWLWRKYS